MFINTKNKHKNENKFITILLAKFKLQESLFEISIFFRWCNIAKIMQYVGKIIIGLTIGILIRINGDTFKAKANIKTKNNFNNWNRDSGISRIKKLWVKLLNSVRHFVCVLEDSELKCIKVKEAREHEKIKQVVKLLMWFLNMSRRDLSREQKSLQIRKELKKEKVKNKLFLNFAFFQIELIYKIMMWLHKWA